MMADLIPFTEQIKHSLLMVALSRLLCGCAEDNAKTIARPEISGNHCKLSQTARLANLTGDGLNRMRCRNKT